MIKLSLIKEELEKKGFNLFIEGKLRYSLLAYILNINPLCPLANEVSEKYGIIGFNLSHFKYLDENKKNLVFMLVMYLIQMKK